MWTGRGCIGTAREITSLNWVLESSGKLWKSLESYVRVMWLLQKVGLTSSFNAR